MKSKILVPVLLENIDMVVNGGVICIGKNVVGIQLEWKVFRPASPFIRWSLTSKSKTNNYYCELLKVSSPGRPIWGASRCDTIYLLKKNDGQEAGLWWRCRTISKPNKRNDLHECDSKEFEYLFSCGISVLILYWFEKNLGFGLSLWCTLIDEGIKKSIVMLGFVLKERKI